MDDRQRAFTSKLSRWGIAQGIRHRTVLADELDVPRRRVNAWFRGVMPGKSYLKHLTLVTGDSEFRALVGKNRQEEQHHDQQ